MTYDDILSDVPLKPDDGSGFAARTSMPRRTLVGRVVRVASAGSARLCGDAAGNVFRIWQEWGVFVSDRSGPRTVPVQANDRRAAEHRALEATASTS